MHMHTAPLALALSLVGFWLALGWAAQVLLRLQLGNLSSLLLSPLIGFTVQLVPVFWFSMVGLPVGSFARPLTIVLAAGAIGAWVIRRPEWDANASAGARDHHFGPWWRADCRR